MTDSNYTEIAIQFSNPLFEEADMKTIASLAKIEKFQKINKEQYLIQQGETADCAYLLLSGNARVSAVIQGKTAQLGTLEPGVLIGEIALLFDIPRTVNIQAVTDIVVLQLDRSDFEATILNDVGALRSMVRKNTKRIQEMTIPLTHISIALESIVNGNYDLNWLKEIVIHDDEVRHLAKTIGMLVDFVISKDRQLKETRKECQILRKKAGMD